VEIDTQGVKLGGGYVIGTSAWGLRSFC